MKAVLLLVVSMVLTPIYAAYAAFDDVQLFMPTWMYVGGPDAPSVIYRLSRHGPRTALLELASRSDKPLSLTMRLPTYQVDDVPFTAQLAAHGTAQVVVPITRMGQRLLRTPLAVALGGKTLVAPPMPLLPLTAFYVSVPEITAHVKPETLGYTISLRDGMADLHLRNFSHDTVHADIHIVDWDGVVPTRLPRVHLLPGMTTELLIPLAKSDPAVADIADAVVEMTTIRFGDNDQGPALVTKATTTDPLRQITGWYPMAIIGSAHTAAQFNSWVLSWQLREGRVYVRNVSPQTIGGTLHVRLGADAQVHAIIIPANDEIILDTTFAAAQRPFVGIADPLIDGQPLSKPSSIITAAAIPEHALPVKPRIADARFNPMTLHYVIERGDTQQARLTIINGSGISQTFNYRIAGYQTSNQPPIVIAAGQSVSVNVPVNKVDIRLAVARLEVWNVHIGASEETLVSVP